MKNGRQNLKKWVTKQCRFKFCTVNSNRYIDILIVVRIERRLVNAIILFFDKVWQFFTSFLFEI